MKQVFIIYVFMLAVLQPALSQELSGKLASFRETVFPQVSTFFSNVSLTGNNQLLLTAVEKYNLLSKADKMGVMDKVVRSWQESLVLVQYQTKKELWGRDAASGKAMLLDSWDISANALIQVPETTSSKIAQHPWFFYLGGQFQLNTDEYINIAFNTRVGFFLLLNRWDLAATYTASRNGYLENTSSTGISAIGLSSKVYFPVKKFNLNPNIGAELSSNTTNISGTKTNAIKPYLLAGISWRVGRGSLDIGFRIGDTFTTMVGYTFMPQMNRSRPK